MVGHIDVDNISLSLSYTKLQQVVAFDALPDTKDTSGKDKAET